MKAIIAGSRNIIEYDIVEECILKSGFNITEIVSGTANGVDKLGEQYAHHHNIPIKQFPADWNNLGKRAGYVRNGEMADYAEALIAIWDGQSKGTKHMIDLAKKKNLIIHVEII